MDDDRVGCVLMLQWNLIFTLRSERVAWTDVSPRSPRLKHKRIKFFVLMSASDAMILLQDGKI